MGQAFYVAGTGTDVGKTFFSCLFMAKYAESYGFRYWKPIQTGAVGTGDTELVQKTTDLPESYFLKPVYEFQTPASPHYASKQEGRILDPKFLLNELSKERKSNTLVEGAGGVFVPWTDDYLTIRGIGESNFPVVVIGSTELGTINHTLLTLDALTSRFVAVLGFYLVGPESSLQVDNAETIQRLGGAPCLGITNFPKQKLSPSEFISFTNNHFDTDRNVIDTLLNPEDEV
ncbi:dethiobiotin synthase [Leptospira sp. 85282-16]|uniref:ATP-dependent dethiobiotin synthetase BioD n=1 Tax=Leptospira montravelensis TaxID=2484961 RepID=A0ABY2LLF8_9LEPT|nr:MULTISPECIES: dethiobiotin synthase [Leptospira]MCT8333386.1 dethiobiotin synthase [Leptospira sp. 85282-16]TGK79830.1 dethiobiotin synthase [Leptospira montravelensis]TGK99993.1 dethiobiotin synthase [Leptospira montravelensis]